MPLHHQDPHRHRHRHQHHPTPPFQTLPATAWPWQPRRGLPLLRRRRVQTVTLGGKRPRRRMVALVRVLRRMRVRWLKLQYLRALRRLKDYYRNIVKDLVEAGATIETFQQRLFMESTFAIPVGVTFSNYPSRLGSDHPRTIFM